MAANLSLTASATCINHGFSPTVTRLHTVADPAGAVHSREIAGGAPQASFAACAELWLKAGSLTLTQLL